MKIRILHIKDFLAWLYPLRKTRKRKLKDGPISKYMRKKKEKRMAAKALSKMDFSSHNIPD